MTEAELLQLAVGVGLLCGALIVLASVITVAGALWRVVRLLWRITTYPLRLLFG